MEIKRTLKPEDQLKPVFSNEEVLKLKFGKHFTDYMFTLQYTEGKGWHSAEIKPYQPLSLDPAAAVFHYGQEVFEGQKAYKSKKDEILMFRPRENAMRINTSLKRLSMPEVPVDDYIQFEEELLKLESRWIPSQKGAALYMRPTVIASEPVLGIKASSEYIFFIILSPVGPYYSTGFNPVGLWVSTTYTRAAIGGTGCVKAGGNYAGSLVASSEAVKKGYGQVLWLDARERKYIEEVGAMNIFFVMDGQLITPPLSGSILPGVTRKSVLQMAPDLGLEPVERPVTIDEVAKGIENGTVKEIFGTGTAAVISPVGKMNYKNKEYVINDNRTGEMAQKFFDTLTGIQYGDLEDKYNWVHKVS